jgi:cyclophilin family peptidyl-prolyl cis-trans isomerase
MVGSGHFQLLEAVVFGGRMRSYKIALFYLFALLSTTIGKNLLAQDSNPSTTGSVSAASTSNAQSTPTQAFEEAQAAVKKQLMKMREVMVRYHLSDDDALDTELRKEWIKEVEKGRPLVLNFQRAAIAAYRENPAANPKMAVLLAQILSQNFETDRYDHSWEVAKALIDGKFEDPEGQIYSLLGLTAMAVNEFAEARKYLEIAYRDGALDQLGQRNLKILEDVESKWEKEKAARERDAAADDLPRVSFETTRGTIVIELFENEAPQTVGNFINLVEKGFYDGLSFHRVVSHLVAQTGCPNGDGSGDAGYTIKSEAKNSNARHHFRGALGMALAGDKPDSGGSQFYICLVPLTFLDGTFTIFGRVIEGMDVVSDLTRIEDEKEDKEPAMGPPDEVITAKVLRKRNHEYKPEYASPPK